MWRLWQTTRKKKLEKDDTKKEPDWITVNGVHIPIKPGQNKDDVVKNFLDKQKDKEPKKDTSQIKNRNDFDKDTDDEIDKDDGEHLSDIHDAYNFKKDGINGRLGELRNKFTNVSAPKELRELLPDLTNKDKRHDAIQKMKSYLSDEDYADFKKQMEHEDKINKNLQDVFDKTEFVYRGISKDELDSINKTGKFGKEDGNFSFVFATQNPLKAKTFGGTVIKINKKDLGDNIQPLLYSSLDSSTDFEKGVYSNKETEFSHHSVAIKKGTSTNAINITYKESICPDCGENVALSGDHSRADVGKKKKKRFEFNEALDEHWIKLIQEVRYRAFTHSSSFVGNVKYDQDEQSMEVILNGKTYDFCNVSERLFDAFEGADSKGAFFNREIKTLHDC